MMDSIILRTLKFRKENKRLSWFHSISSIVLLIFFIFCALFVEKFWSGFVFSLAIAAMISRSFIIYHDYAHGTILRKSYFAKAMYFIYGIYVLAPLNVWKRSHDYHHRNIGKFFKPSIGSYPLVSKKKFNDFSKVKKVSYLFVRHPIVILFGYLFTFLYGMCIHPFISNPKKHFDSLLALCFHFSYMFLVFSMKDFQHVLLVVIIPHFLASALGAYLFYVQHNFPDAKYKNKDNWNYTFSALESSSFLKMNKVMRWITGNIGYHHIHHLNPSIPFYKLPETMESIVELQNPKSTSFKLRDIIACLKLKVWDEDTQMMTGI